MESRCSFWLPKKKRFCANFRINDSVFCGNHNTRSDAEWVSCPIDPSHSVLSENLEGHMKRCPLLKQAQSLSSQPFYQKGINGGKYDEDEGDEKGTVAPTFASLENTTSVMKRNAVYSMTVPEFSKLISKIQSIHSSICNDIRDSYRVPEACDTWIKGEVDRKLPFQEKHVVQQVSILGNLEEFGVLKRSSGDVVMEQCDSDGSSGDDNGVPAVVEFGAGRGYLTQMLADCYGIKKVFLVERKSYKLKADRTLRQKESLILERLRIDMWPTLRNALRSIEDLNLKAVESLQGVPYLAIGKHLCGPATDLSLRCCLAEESGQGDTVQCRSGHYLRGLAIATCCHHLCQWKHYINKEYLINLGITKDDFHAISWFTSWAVDADHGSDLSDIAGCRLHLQSIEKKECVEAVGGVAEIVQNMKAMERAVLGFMCKEIIDMGRLMWVQEHGLETQLVKYVPPTISPENHLLIAKHANHL